MQILSVNTPPEMDDKKFWRQALVFQLIYSLVGLLAGLFCIVGGMILFLHGVAGSISWTANILGMESGLSDAAPGALLFVIGLFVIWTSRFNVEAGKK